MKLLVTAFEPFGGEEINPALEAVKLLPPSLGGAELLKLTVPTAFSRAADAVTAAILSEKPGAVLMIGQAGGRSAITPERAALNIASASIADNDGCRPVEEPIEPEGPAAYFSTLPIVNMVEAIRGEALPASVSNTAGTFVCNYLMYSVLHFIAAHKLGVRAGFMHVPFAPEQTAKQLSPAPSMSVKDIERGIEAALGAVIGSI